MDDRAVFALLGLVHGDAEVFKVTVAADDYIYKLKARLRTGEERRTSGCKCQRFVPLGGEHIP